MAKNIKFKGKLWVHFNWPLILWLVLVLGNISVYFYDAKAGMIVSSGLVLFLLVTIGMSIWSSKYVVNEVVNFATQYSSVQKQLLNEFQIPYALLDGSGKVLWVNDKFAELAGIDKKYHKSITAIFPALTKEAIYRSEEVTDIRFEYNEMLLRGLDE
jgi:c-di-AMP phosphodiesterase-like protein